MRSPGPRPARGPVWLRRGAGGMGKTVRDHLLDTLEELGQEAWKRFKSQLNRVPVEAGYSNIPRGPLERADVLDVCDKLLSYYREEYAVRVTGRVLIAINERELADRLHQATGIGGEGEKPVSAPGGAMGKEVSPAGHFVDRFRTQLIERTTPVEPILDLLHGKVLDNEQYQTIRSGRTSPEKMRMLYQLMPSWNTACKDRFYEALKAKNKFLVEDLEGS